MRQIGSALLATALLSSMSVGCRPANNPKASLLAQQEVASGFNNASPQWGISKNCNPSSPDFYVCLNYVNVSAYRTTFPNGPDGGPPPPPRLFKTFSTTTQSVTPTPDGNYAVKVQVDGVCAFSEAGSLFGQLYRCGGADRPYQSVFDVDVRQEGVFGTKWSVARIQEAPGMAERRNEEQQAAVKQADCDRFMATGSPIASWDQVASLQVWMNRGVDVRTCRDTDGNTVLMKLAWHQYPSLDAIQHLLTLGVDVNARNNAGETALGLAQKRLALEREGGFYSSGDSEGTAKVISLLQNAISHQP